MNSSILIPFFMIASAKKSRRKRLTDALIPAMIPVAPAHQPAISAIAADMQVRGEDRRLAVAQAKEAEIHNRLINETVAVGEKLLTGNKLPAAELAKFPILKKALEASPDLLGKIVQ